MNSILWASRLFEIFSLFLWILFVRIDSGSRRQEHSLCQGPSQRLRLGASFKSVLILVMPKTTISSSILTLEPLVKKVSYESQSVWVGFSLPKRTAKIISKVSPSLQHGTGRPKLGDPTETNDPPPTNEPTHKPNKYN